MNVNLEEEVKEQGQQQLQEQPPSFGAKVVEFFKAPPSSEPIQDREQIKKDYGHWRLRTFYSIFIAYVVFYLCKKNISAAMPGMEAALGYSNTQLGILGSSLYFTYAIGKFVNGVLADNSNVRRFLPFALMVSAMANILFVVNSLLVKPDGGMIFGVWSSSAVLLGLMAMSWGMNGWFQSMGFPAIAKSLTFWYSNSERGTKWALWSTSHQTGTFLSVIMSGFLISKFGWQAAFLAPAVIAIIMSFVLYERLRDKPQTIGLPDIEEYREPEKQTMSEEEKHAEDNISYGEIFKKHILFNKTIWMLAIAYIFVYIIRFGTEDWIIKYLVDVKKDTIGLAAMKLSFLPLFGIAGTIAAGYFSDKIFKGQRAPINVIFLTGIVFSLMGLMFNKSGPNFIDSGFLALTGNNLGDVLKFGETSLNGGALLDFLYIGLIGMFTYGPQMLIGGLCAIESSSKKVASAATGFTGSFGYLGAILSGVGTGAVIDKFGWNGAIYFWAISAVLCIAICLPMCIKKS